MAYKFDDYDFSECKGCHELHMHIHFGLCRKCLNRQLLITTGGKGK